LFEQTVEADNLSKNPTVSIVIPTYNSSGTLRLALQTVLLQDFRDFEVWVIGDGCTDDSEKMVDSYHENRVHWLNLPTNSGGPSLPRREGITNATGRYIAYIGHDDLWFPWHLTELVDCIETTGSDFVYSLGAIIAPEGVSGTFSLPHNPWSPNGTISPINWLHRKDLLGRGVSWPTNVKYGDDREFLRLLLNANVRLEFRKQLSAMKFPAQSWAIYSVRNHFPQQKYVQELRRDAYKLRDDLLESAAAASVEQRLTRPFYRRFMNKAVFDLLYLYGFQRWPINQLLYRRYRKRSGLNVMSRGSS
jgi:glycosyltransferase involved in cell wall biosynthesis